MFMFPGRPLFSDHWNSHQLRFPDASFDMPWGFGTCNTAEGMYGPRHRREGHQHGECCTKQSNSSLKRGVQDVPRQQQGSRTHATAAHPEPASRKLRMQQHQHTSQQAAPQPSTTSETSYSSYSSALDDTSEPMDVCSCPHTPTVATANDSSSYSSADSGYSRDPDLPAQQQEQQQQQQQQQQPAATSKAATASAAAQQQQQQQGRASACRNSSTVNTTDQHTAAIVIQSAWRMYRLARHRAATKQLAQAACQLRSINAQLAAAAAAAAAAGTALSQKQYLELSETVMRVLFLLDSVSCAAAAELRTIRKRLTVEANGLLDKINAAHRN